MYRHKADALSIKLQLDCVEPLKSVGGNNNPEGKNQHNKELGQVDIINLSKPKKTQGGNSTDYLLAKIKRDRPDIAQRLADGGFKSVRHAAIRIY